MYILQLYYKRLIILNNCSFSIVFVFSNLAMHSGLLLEVCKCDQGYRLRSPITSRIRFAEPDAESDMIVCLFGFQRNLQ